MAYISAICVALNLFTVANAQQNATTNSTKPAGNYTILANGTIVNGTHGNQTNVTVRPEATYPEDLLTHD
jgi:hypothetical protein